MLRRSLSPLVLVVACFASALSAAVPLVNLVDDRTLAVLSVPNAPELVRTWDRNPLATSWADPQVVKFLAPLRGQLEVDAWDDQAKEATGLTVRELLALAGGELLVALPSFDPATREHGAPPPFLFAMQLGGQAAKLTQILADSAEKNKVREESEDYAGVKVTIRTPSADEDGESAAKTLAWALVEDVWVISAEKERVFAAIDALKQGGVDSALGKSERFLRTRERTAQAAALVYVNFPAVYPLLEQAIAGMAASSSGRPNRYGIEPETTFAALGLDALGECYLAMSGDAKETRIDAGLIYAEKRGILKLLAYETGPAPKPDWIPAKWTSVSTARFNFAKSYTALEELLDAVSPLLSGLTQGQIRTYNRKLGIDLKRDLVGSLGNELVSAYGLPSDATPGTVTAWDEMDQFFAVSLANEEAFTQAIDALKNLAGPMKDKLFSKRDYLGGTIYTLNLPAGPEATGRARGFSYAIAGKMFVFGIGSPAMVESALQGIKTGEGGFWKRDDVQAMLVRMPDDAMTVQVQDLRVMIGALVETAVRLQKATATEPAVGTSASAYVDPAERPDDAVIARHWGMSGGYSTRTTEGLFSTWYLDNPQP